MSNPQFMRLFDRDVTSFIRCESCEPSGHSADFLSVNAAVPPKSSMLLCRC